MAKSKQKKQKTVLSPQKGSQEDFINAKAEITFYGGAAGSGKSHALLLEPLQHLNDPNYNCVFFRRTTAQLEGSLWPEAKKIYGQFKGVKFHERDKTVKWPSGAKFKFAYMELDKHADFNHQGLQYSAVFWDEFTHYNSLELV